MVKHFALLLLVLLCGLGAIFLFLGFTQAQAAPQAVTITIWHTEVSSAALDELVANFEAANPTINVNLEYFPSPDIYTEYQYQAAAGGGPDLLLGVSDRGGGFASRDLVRPIDGEFDLTGFLPEVIEPVIWNGRTWGVPAIFGNHLMLLYNKSLLADAPADSAELVAAAQALALQGKHGLVYNTNEPFWLIPWLTGFGGWVLGADSGGITPTLAGPEMIAALQYVHDLRFVDSVVPTTTLDYGSAEALFLNGEAGMLINGDWALGNYSSTLGADLGIARIPQLLATGDWPQPMISGRYWFFNPNSTSDGYTASQAFVEFASTLDSQLLWAEQGYLPALSAALADPLVQNNPLLQASADQASLGRGMPVNPEMACVWGAIFDPLAQVMDDALAPADAAAQMQAEAAACVHLLRQNAAWLPANQPGFGNAQNIQLPALEAFGNYLYAGVQNVVPGNPGDPPTVTAQIWRSLTGFTWEQVDSRPASAAADLAEFDGYLYAGSWDGLIWRSPDGLNWSEVLTSSSGLTDGIARFQVYAGALYASTWEGDTGTQIWRTSDGLDWEQINAGLGGSGDNGGAIASVVFNDELYWGVGNWVTGAELWRYDGIQFTQVITGGFGDPLNKAVSALAEFQGYLYAGMFNDSAPQVWRSPDGDAWSQVAPGEIGASGAQHDVALEVHGYQLYLAVANETTGMEVWRTADGEHWQQVGFGGFGDPDNQRPYFDNALTNFNGHLYVGSTNFTAGATIFELASPPQPLYLPLMRKP